MKLKKLIKDQYGGDDNIAAKACGTTVETLRNWKCQEREVLPMAGGGYVLKSSKTIIFKLIGDRNE